MACWNLIQHQELSGAASSVTFTGISASYDHLVLLSSARSDASAYTDWVNFQVNNDTGSNYSRRALNNNTGTANAVSGSSEGVWTYNYIPAASALAATFGVMETWFINYSNTANYKQILSTSSASNNSGTSSQYGMRFEGGLWSSTAAISEIDILTGGSDDFVQYSTFTLYGINGAG